MRDAAAGTLRVNPFEPPTKKQKTSPTTAHKKVSFDPVVQIYDYINGEHYTQPECFYKQKVNNSTCSKMEEDDDGNNGDIGTVFLHT